MLTITEAIDFVFWEARGVPMTAKEVFRRLPRDFVDTPLDTRTFWQYFGMYLKHRKHKVGWVFVGKFKAYYLFEFGINA